MITMTIRPPAELRRRLKKIAQQKGLTVNALVISIFWDYVNKVQDKRKQ